MSRVAAKHKKPNTNTSQANETMSFGKIGELRSVSASTFKDDIYVHVQDVVK